MFTSANNARRAAVIGLACLAPAGCALGPNFSRPAAPALDRYDAGPAPGAPSAYGAPQTLALGKAVDPNWWRLFGSSALNALVAQGLKDSPTLASAEAALDQSRDQARAGAGVFWPSASASASGVREKINPAQLGQTGRGSTFSVYTAAGSISYALDLFGGERRTVEALSAQADYQRNAVGAAYLALTGNIVDAAIARAGYADQVGALSDIVTLEGGQRDILSAEYQAGHGALSAVLAAEQQLAADQESLATAGQRLAASSSLLNALMGEEPAETSPPAPALDALAIPAEAPVSLPSQLVRQRPDVLEAEAQLHQASAEVGAATAALFPSISLTGDYGAASESLAALSSPAGRFWSVGPSVDIPLFRGGALWFSRKAAEAALIKAQADYRQTVLAALEQTADQIKALGADARTADAARRAFDAAVLDNQLGQVNLRAGMIADYDAMSLQIQADRARLNLIAAKAQRLQDVVALYLASGGGWTGRTDSSGALAAAQ